MAHFPFAPDKSGANGGGTERPAPMTRGVVSPRFVYEARRSFDFAQDDTGESGMVFPDCFPCFFVDKFLRGLAKRPRMTA
jgi:hypothetical protein